MFDASFLLRMLISALLTASGLSWLRWGLRPEQFGGPPSALPDDVRPAAEEIVPAESLAPVVAEPTPWPPIAVFAVLFWIATNMLTQIVADTQTLWKSSASAAGTNSKTDDAATSKTADADSRNRDAIWSGMVMGCSLFVVVGCLLFLTGRLRPDDVGIHAEDWPAQVAWGLQAFLASFAPTFLMLLATFWFRSRETEHPFLQMLSDDPDAGLLWMLFFVAAVVAPLSEELVFRVTLQGWLTDQWNARGAIITTALVFSFVHGWRDGIALIPLALILGCLYHFRRSYLAVVTTHAIFNATQMAMALLGAMSASE